MNHDKKINIHLELVKWCNDEWIEFEKLNSAYDEKNARYKEIYADYGYMVANEDEYSRSIEQLEWLSATRIEIGNMLNELVPEGRDLINRLQKIKRLQKAIEKRRALSKHVYNV